MFVKFYIGEFWKNLLNAFQFFVKTKKIIGILHTCMYVCIFIVTLSVQRL